MSSTASTLLPEPLPPHPRLFATAQDWARINRQVCSDPVSSRIFASLVVKAESLLDALPVERVMNGFRMLYVSRQVLERVGILAGLFRVTGKRKYAKRAIQEMTAVARFSDWNPSHHLDTAEMALAIAIGYDWLNDQLTQEERELIATALLEKGLAPSLSDPQRYWWITGNNNWNQVCHAGLSAAAIAIADREPEKARQTLQRAIDNIAPAAEVYRPDGAYPEGPMYWNYGTSFHVLLAAALQALTGSTQGVDAYPGFSQTGFYMVQMTAPSGNVFNYADCRLTRHLLIPLFWMARQYGQPAWLASEIANLEEYMERYERNAYDDYNYRLLIMALIWRDPQSSATPASSPAHWLGRGSVPVAVHRGQGLYVAIKGGSPSASHGHMDTGSFVLEADGVRWFVDPGMQDYEGLEESGVDLWDRKQDGEGWTVFRLGPESHSILRFGGRPQIIAGNGQFIRFQAEGAAPHSVLDLTSLYSGQARAVHRGLMIIENRSLLLQDEWIAMDDALEVDSQLMTEARVTVDGNSIRLEQHGKHLNLYMLEPAGAKIEVRDAKELQQPYDAENPGLHRIVIRMNIAAGERGRMRILALPGSAAPVQAPPMQPLEEWSAACSAVQDRA